MVKVVWFLKKADHLSMEEFRRWWLDGHAPMIREKLGDLLRRSIVDIRTDPDDLPAPRASCAVLALGARDPRGCHGPCEPHGADGGHRASHRRSRLTSAAGSMSGPTPEINARASRPR